MINGTAHTGSEVDAQVLSQLIEFNKNKHLVIAGYKPDGKKIQKWMDGAVDWELHLKGIKKQGGLLVNEGKSKNIVIDIDAELPAAELAAAAYKIDNKLILFHSPSGKKWHVWKFYPESKSAKEVHAEAKKIEKQFIKLYGKDVDVAKTQPSLNGLTGINFPFCSPEQFPYSPAGVKLTWKQFLFRIKFQEHPIISIAAGLQEPGRHDALIIMAAYLHKKDMMHNLDEVIEAMDNFNDEEYINRIKNKKIHEVYDVGSKAINQTITNIIQEDYQLPAEEEEVTDDLEVEEYTGLEKIQPRPWLIFGWMLENALTLLIGQPGIGKTMLLHMLAYALATGNSILGKEIIKRGNVLIIAAEETQNEINLRLNAASQMMGKNDKKFKIYKRGLERELKLVKFTKDGAQKTKQYKKLLNLIKNKNIKYIVLDPLINFQEGSYDENSNQNMDAYVKNYLIPIAVSMRGAVIAGHHTNKLSMVSTQDNELLVDNQNALMAARGASSLIGAARFVLALQPMTRKLWDHHFKEHITDGTNFVHYSGMIEAKSNYNVIEEDISWLQKQDVSVVTADGFTEKVGFFSTTELNKITKAKNKLKAAKNLQWVKSQMSKIISVFEIKGEDKITLNSIVNELLPLDPDFADGKVLEATIKTRIRRKLINGLSGKEETKDGYQKHGIEHDDGYNYWVKADHSSEGSAKYFIERAVDFKRKNAAR